MSTPLFAAVRPRAASVLRRGHRLCVHARAARVTLPACTLPCHGSYRVWSRPFSVASSSSSSSPPLSSTPPPLPRAAAVLPAAVATPQTLSSLELLSADHFVQRGAAHLQSRSSTKRDAQEAGFRAINDHGLIGNCRTAALVGLDGCIDWYCYPHFDSPFVFGALLDSQRGGHFSVKPRWDSPPYHEQRYEDDTNVLVTIITNQERERQKKSTERRWKRRGAAGSAPQEVAITDFLPIADDAQVPGMGWLVRELHCRRGPLQADIHCFPAFQYAMAEHSVAITEDGVKFLSSNLNMVLTASCPVQWTVSPNRRGVFGLIRLAEGERATLVFRELQPAELNGPIDPQPLAVAPTLLERTRAYWHEWMKQCTYRGRWASSVRRSALALKLMVFAPEGSCVASPTTSLPETLGGVRNWDYRYAWIRDSSFIIASLLRLGFHAESRAFIAWLQRRAADMQGGVQGHGLQALYGLRGEKRLDERELPHLAGYLHSRPVRIGNGAYGQIQLDIYGEMLETVWLAHVTGARPMDLELWSSLRPCIDWIVAHRLDKDQGVWEVRGGKQSFTYSRLMIWTAVDRAIKLAEELQRQYASAHSSQRTGGDELGKGGNADASEYGAGHVRSAAVQNAKREGDEDQRRVAAPEVNGQQAAPSAHPASSTLTSPALPASQRMDARNESSAFLSSIQFPPLPDAASALPPELCEGCTIPPPSPRSPSVTSQPQHMPPVDWSISLSSSSTSPSEVFPGLLTSDLEWWQSLRASLFAHLLQQAFNEKRQAFVQHIATPPLPSTCTVLDAACLAFPLYGFLPPNNPLVTSTLNAILAPIGEGGLMQNHLVYRYNVSHTKDGCGGEEEGTFVLCTQWAIEGLAKWGRTGDDAALHRAELMMEQMVGMSNHLELYSEELLLHKGTILHTGQTFPDQRRKGVMKEEPVQPVINEEDEEDVYEEEADAETRYVQVGNFPQAFSHLAFVNAALELNAALVEREARLKQKDMGQQTVEELHRVTVHHEQPQQIMVES